ncbi:TIGR03915 family putative DNA repair protein [Lacrimispora sp. NSJ-141]|uniref:TIGR03915 family putative DNA repair protein n=1 Tax=Lientehia hominis TaxID=2897778 RepID=A0AAP2RHC9_9FIRM|nr:TIGR03915 family putative DNA repair protein [Lientehia hominis]MCD2491313.1 TIGR03915 family putative DNA repair protein [Lientehia hominis]
MENRKGAMNMKGYLCEDTVEGIFTGVYDAWVSGMEIGHENVRLFLKRQYEPELFFEYEEVFSDADKAEKVARTIRKKISGEAFRRVYRTAMSSQPDRADAIYRFLMEGFRYKEDTLRMLQLPAVGRVFELARKVANEAHLFLEFIRFKQLKNGVLFAVIAPKSNVLTLVAPHFEDRFSGENWIIYDETRALAAVHEALKPYAIARLTEEQAGVFLDKNKEKDGYTDLWKVFFNTIGIEDRKNYRCQRTMMPLWYRKHMTEFL